MALNLSPSFDQQRWVIQIRRTLEEEHEDDNEIPVCIFNVPKTLLSSKPDSYYPQQVAIGPYHYWRPELYEMERYKLSAAKRTQKQHQSLRFQHFVEHLVKLEPRIRACYHKYLDFNGETLAWMMAVDASFLLEFLQAYAIREGKVLTRISSRMSHLVDYAGMKSAHNAILRDIVMLENQIPLFLLRKMLEFQCSSIETADDVLNSMLMGLCQEISPFKMNDISSVQLSECTHLLDFLYNMIVPRSDEPSEINEADHQNEPIDDKEGSSANSGHVKQLFSEIWKWLLKLNKGLVRYLKKALLSRTMKFVVKLPWNILSRLPGFALLKQPVEYLFFSENKEDIKPEDEGPNSTNKINKPPLIEEIMIPSVTQLIELGVRFSTTNGDITTISFDHKTVTLYLPTVNLDVNTDIILRNLVAYETSIALGPLVLTRYTELMNGIIDTEEDAKLLRDRGIVLNRLKSDLEVANVWNGMSQSVRLTRVPFLDKVIEDVNKYYSGRWKVKAGKFMKTYVFGSWKFLTFLAAIMLLLLMILQAFCSVYSCGRIFHINTAN